MSRKEMHSIEDFSQNLIQSGYSLRRDYECGFITFSNNQDECPVYLLYVDVHYSRFVALDEAYHVIAVNGMCKLFVQPWYMNIMDCLYSIKEN